MQMRKIKLTDDTSVEEAFDNFTDEEIADFFMKKMVSGLLGENEEDKEDALKFMNGVVGTGLKNKGLL